jgi:DNA/RNA-binding protein KIN17
MWRSSSSTSRTQQQPTPRQLRESILKDGISGKPKNVFSAAKKNALGGKKALAIEQPKKMSEAERIMREEMEQKSKRGPTGFGGPPQKKPRF